MRQSAEVGIVGAGPAGARAAELLAGQGADVLLLDPKAPWEKPCGGGLTSALFDDFPELEQVKPLARAINRARVELGPQAGFDVRLDTPIWMIAREALARWQLDRALEAGASHEPARVTSIERSRHGWLLETDRGALEALCLIGADGAASTVRSAVAPALAVELMPTRVAYPPIDGPPPEALVLRFFHRRVGYLWDFPRLDHRSVGIEVDAGTWRRPELDGRIDEYHQASAGQATASLTRAGAVIGTAQHGHGDFSRIAGPGFALLGDAAGFADPFTGEGIRNALRSAQLLAEAWRMGRSDWTRTYPALARAAFAREFAVARLLRRLLSETGAGVRLVESALASDLSYAIVVATLGVVSVHDYGLGHFLRRSLRAFSEVRADPARRGAAARA